LSGSSDVGDAGVSAAESSVSLYQSTVLDSEDGEQVPATGNDAEAADEPQIDTEDKIDTTEPVRKKTVYKLKRFCIACRI